jgi:DNA processing protein
MFQGMAKPEQRLWMPVSVTPPIYDGNMFVTTPLADPGGPVTVELPPPVPSSDAERWLHQLLESNPQQRLSSTDLLALVAREPGSASAKRFWLHRLTHLTSLQRDVHVVVAGSPQYPQQLREAFGSPPMLYVEGTLDPGDLNAVAIVGSRHASSAGLHAASDVAAELAAAGHTVVAGLAVGIDTAAHEGALAGGGRTIAVLGTGIDKVFPAENADLARRIPDHGCLVSQFLPGSPPSKTSFPARNAVIAGLSAASLLVEATERSGTRIEANFALAQGRPVLLWGPILGQQQWARDFLRTPGVAMVASAAEIRDHLTESRRIGY